MKLRNKKTREVIDDGYVREIQDFQFDGQTNVLAVFKGDGYRQPERVSRAYRTLAELNEEWEDYKEPKEQYYIKENGAIGTCGAVEDDIPEERLSEMNQIGNYFETKEEAEKAVEKLKAWKRLKDGGVKFKLASIANDDTATIFARFPNREKFQDLNGNLYKIFGGEE